MLTEKELRIIELYRKNIFASYTIREIMKKINTKSYNWIHNAVKKLKTENILKCEEKGRSILCSINLEEQKTLVYLSLIEETNPLIKKISNKTPSGANCKLTRAKAVKSIALSVNKIMPL